MQTDLVHSVSADGYDYEKLDRLKQGDTPLQEAIAAGGDEHESFPDLVDDVFMALYKPVPRLAETVVPSRRLNKRVMEGLVESRDVQALRAAGTIGDAYLASVATATLTEAARAALAQQLDSDLEASDALARMVELLHAGVRSEAEQDELDRLQDEQVVETLAETEEALEGALDDTVDAVRQAVKRAVAAATEQVDDLQQTRELVTHWGTGKGDGGPRQQGTLVQQAAELVKANPYLPKLLKLLGRMRKQLELAQRAKTEGGITPVGVELGDDIGGMLPDELLSLAVPELAEQFAYRRVTKQLLQLRREAKEPLADGPLVVVVDESGSMQLGGGIRRLWASAVTFCLLQLGKDRNRPVRVIHMGDRADGLVTDDFEPDAYTLAEAIDCVNHFFNGGNDFDYWTPSVYEALQKDERYGKADVVLITDGGGRAKPATVTAWRTQQQALGFRCLGVAIAPSGTDIACVEDFADRTFPLTDAALTGRADTAALEALFAV